MVDLRIPALRRFAAAITFLNLIGHFYLGFEQSWAQLFTSLFTAYSLELFLEWLDCKIYGKACRFRGGLVNFIDFLLPAHISGLAVAMLIFGNDRLLPFAFAASVAICSKAIFRIKMGKGRLHFLNPSNTGIAITLLIFPSIGIAPGWQFSAHLDSLGNWLLPYIVVGLGTFLNGHFTKRIPLILGWLFGFVAQAVIRTLLFHNNLFASLVPITGFAFILFTFYMVTDPATTPICKKRQIFFGLSVAAVYGVLQMTHMVYGLFIALLIVCTTRGLWIHFVENRALKPEPVAVPQAEPEIAAAA